MTRSCVLGNGDALDPDGPEAGEITLERVEPKTGEIHVARPRRLVDACEHALDLGRVLGNDSAPVTGLVQR